MKPVTWKKRVVESKSSISSTLFYQEKGKGHPVVLLHGLAESSYTWRYIFDDLARDNHVFAFDLKGFGLSPKPRDGRYSVYDQALAVRQMLEDKNIRGATVIGHSFGGGVALALALMDKGVGRVGQLVLVDAAVYQQELPSMLQRLKKPLLGTLGLYLTSPFLQAQTAYQFAFHDKEKIPVDGVKEASKNLMRRGSRYALVQTVVQMIPDDVEMITREYSTLDHKVLIIWGEKDKVVLPYNAHRLHRAIKNSKLIILEKIGHMPQEESPKRLLSLIQRFIDSLRSN